MKQKIIYRLLLLVAAVILSPASSWAWSGTGLEADPIIIDNRNDLQMLAEKVAAGDYDPTNFVNGEVFVKLSDTYSDTGTFTTPIGEYSAHPFRGHFDGNGKTITGLTMTRDGDYCGLFGYVNGYKPNSVHKTIENLTLKNVTVNCKGSNVGALVGYMQSGSVKDVTIDGLLVTSTGDNKMNVGGVIGYINGGSMENVAVKNMAITTTGTTYSVGALVGGITPGVSMTNNSYDIHTKVTSARYTTAVSYWDTRKADVIGLIAKFGTKATAGIAIGSSKVDGGYSFDLLGGAQYKSTALTATIDAGPYYYDFGYQVVPTWTTSAIAGQIHIKDDGIEIPHNVYEALSDPEDITSGDVTSIVEWQKPAGTKVVAPQPADLGTYTGHFTLRNEETVDATYTIEALPLTEATYTLEPATFTYNGDMQVPTTVTVTMKDSKDVEHTLTTTDGAEGKYTVSYKTSADVDIASPTDAGTYKVIITGAGNFTGTPKAANVQTFVINKLNFQQIKSDSIGYVSFTAIPNETYNGAAHTPTVTAELQLKADGTKAATFVSPTDFTVAYSNNINAGTATVTITAANPNYDGTATTTFTIDPKDLSNTWTWTIGTKEYNGLFQCPTTVTVNDEDIVGTPALVFNTDFELDVDTTNTISGGINAGDYTVRVKGKGNYSTTVVTLTQKFTITPKSIAGVTFTFNPASYTYTGSEIKPGTDKFTVTDAAIMLGDPAAAKVLVANTDFELDLSYDTDGYKDNVNVGNATLQIKGKGNYSSTTTAIGTFAITKLALDTLKIEFDPTELTYKGWGIVPTNIYVYMDKNANGQYDAATDVLIPAADYDLSYKDTLSVSFATTEDHYTDAGKVYVKATGKGANTEGTTDGTHFYTILPKPITEVVAEYGWTWTTAFTTPVTYDGADHKPVLNKIEDKERTTHAGGAGHEVYIVENTDFTQTWTTPGWDANASVVRDTVAYSGATITDVVRYNNGTDDNAVGYYHYTVEGTGNYTGTVTKDLTINPADFSTVTITAISDIPYDSQRHKVVPELKLGMFIVNTTDYTTTYPGNTADNDTMYVNADTWRINVASAQKNFGNQTHAGTTFNIVPAALQVKLLAEAVGYNRNVRLYNANGDKVIIDADNAGHNYDALTIDSFTVKYDGTVASTTYPVNAKTSYAVTLELTSTTHQNNYTVSFVDGSNNPITNVGFTINKKNISNDTDGSVAVTIDQTDAIETDKYPFKDADWTPVDTVKWTSTVSSTNYPNAPNSAGAYQLVSGTDYEFYLDGGKKYFTDAACTTPAANTTNVGTYYFKVQGKGDNYEGSLVKSFIVDKISIKPYVDENNVYAGFHIVSGDTIDNVMVDPISDYNFNGTAQGPDAAGITLKRWIGGAWKTLTAGTDYELVATNAYSCERDRYKKTTDAIDAHAGTYKVKVVGKGNYKDENEQTTYNIQPRDISNLTTTDVKFILNKDIVNEKENPIVADDTDPNGPQIWNYDGTAKQPTTVTITELTSPLSGYTVVYKTAEPVNDDDTYDYTFTNEKDTKDNTLASTNVKRENGEIDGDVIPYLVTVTATDYGNYTGTRTLYYQIDPIAIGGGTVDGMADNIAFEPHNTGTPVEKTVTIDDFDDLFAPVSLRSEYSESVMLYTSDELKNQFGLVDGDQIVAISFPGYNEAGSCTATVDAWYEWTTDVTQTAPANGLYDYTGLTKIVDSKDSTWTVKGSVSEPRALYTIYFDTPLTYEEGKGLRLVMKHATAKPVIGIKHAWNNTVGQHYWHWANNQTDFENTSDWNKLRTGAPAISFRKGDSPLLPNQVYAGKPIVDVAPAVVDGVEVTDPKNLFIWDYTTTDTENSRRIVVKNTLTGQPLVKGTDYSVEYKDNKYPGTATIIIRGIGNYSSSFLKQFIIEKGKIWGVDIVNVLAPEVGVLLDHDAPIHLDAAPADLKDRKIVVLYSKDSDGNVIQMNHNADPADDIEGAEAWVEHMSWIDETNTDRTGWKASAGHKYTVTAKVWLGHDEPGVALYAANAFNPDEAEDEHALASTTWVNDLFEFGDPLDMPDLKVNGKPVNAQIHDKKTITLDYSFVITADEPVFSFNPQNRRLSVTVPVNKETNVNTYLVYQVNADDTVRINNIKERLFVQKRDEFTDASTIDNLVFKKPLEKAFYTFEIPAFRVNSNVHARVDFQKDLDANTISKIDEVSRGAVKSDKFYITAAPAVGQIENTIWSEQIDALDKLTNAPDAVKPHAQIGQVGAELAGENTKGATLYYAMTAADTETDALNAEKDLLAAIDYHYGNCDTLQAKNSNDELYTLGSTARQSTIEDDLLALGWKVYDPATGVTDLEAQEKAKYITYYFLAKDNQEDDATYAADSHYGFSEVTKYRAENKEVYTTSHEWNTYLAERNLTVPADLKVYTITGMNDAEVVLEEQKAIQANVPVLLKKITNSTSAEKFYLSSLQVDPLDVDYGGSTLEDATKHTNYYSIGVNGNYVGVQKGYTLPWDQAEGTPYVLKNGEFIRANSGSVPEQRCFLDMNPSVRNFVRIALPADDADAIDAVEVAGMSGDWYNLKGQKLDQAPTKAGLYIFNGRKVVIK